MTVQTAKKLLNLVNTLEGMRNEVAAKQRLLKTRMQDCHTDGEASTIKDATVILGAELDHINITIDLVDDLVEDLSSTELQVA